MARVFGIDMDEQFYRGKVWRDYVETTGRIEARFAGGNPAF